jgi:hypothetical protein
MRLWRRTGYLHSPASSPANCAAIRAQRPEVCPFFATQPVRLYDLHLKDRFSAEVNSPNVEAGRGLIDLAAVLRRAAQA